MNEGNNEYATFIHKLRHNQINMACRTIADELLVWLSEYQLKDNSVCSLDNTYTVK